MNAKELIDATIAQMGLEKACRHWDHIFGRMPDFRDSRHEAFPQARGDGDFKAPAPWHPSKVE